MYTSAAGTAKRTPIIVSCSSSRTGWPLIRNTGGIFPFYVGKKKRFHLFHSKNICPLLFLVFQVYIYIHVCLLWVEVSVFSSCTVTMASPLRFIGAVYAHSDFTNHVSCWKMNLKSFTTLIRNLLLKIISRVFWEFVSSLLVLFFYTYRCYCFSAITIIKMAMKSTSQNYDNFFPRNRIFKVHVTRM
jgi:hypothetical protein